MSSLRKSGAISATWRRLVKPAPQSSTATRVPRPRSVVERAAQLGVVAHGRVLGELDDDAATRRAAARSSAQAGGDGGVGTDVDRQEGAVGQAVDLGEPAADGEALELDADLGAVRLGEPHVGPGIRVAGEARERLVAARRLVGSPTIGCRCRSTVPAARTAARRSKRRWSRSEADAVSGPTTSSSEATTRVCGEAAPSAAARRAPPLVIAGSIDRDLGPQPRGEADGVVGGLGEADQLEAVRVHDRVGEPVELDRVGEGDQDALRRAVERAGGGAPAGASAARMVASSSSAGVPLTT